MVNFGVTVFPILVTLVFMIDALQVSPDSPCASLCLDDPTSNATDPDASNTIATDISCLDADYANTTKGQKFVSCVNCLATSTASSMGENDQDWFLYNLRFALVTCLFTLNNSTDAKATVCTTSESCEPLQPALDEDNLDATNESKYGYCSASDNAFRGTFLGSCESCLSDTEDQKFLRNFIAVLDTGCDQRSGASLNVGFKGSIFSDVQINGTYAGYTEASADSNVPHKKRLSKGAIVGIAVGSAAFLAIIIASTLLCFRKLREARRLKAILSPLDERYGAKNITAPTSGAFGNPYSPAPPIKTVDTIHPSSHSNDWTMSSIVKDQISNPTPYSQELLPSNTWQDKNTSRSDKLSPNPPPTYAGQQMPTHQAYIPTSVPVSPISTVTTIRTSSNYSSTTQASPRNLPSAPSYSTNIPSQPHPQRPVLSPVTLPSRAPTPASYSQGHRRTPSVGIGNVNASKEIPVKISGPIVHHGGRLDFQIAARERWWRERQGNNVHTDALTLKKKKSMVESPDSDEQWPGSY